MFTWDSFKKRQHTTDTKALQPLEQRLLLDAAAAASVADALGDQAAAKQATEALATPPVKAEAATAAFEDSDGDGLSNITEGFAAVTTDDAQSTVSTSTSTTPGSATVNNPTTGFTVNDTSSGNIVSFTATAPGESYSGNGTGTSSELFIQLNRATNEIVDNEVIRLTQQGFDEGLIVKINGTTVVDFDSSHGFGGSFGAKYGGADGSWQPWANEGNPQLEIDISNGSIRLMVDTNSGGREDALADLPNAKPNAMPIIDSEAGFTLSIGSHNTSGPGGIGQHTVTYSATMLEHRDSDGDGVADYQDIDSDNDGILDAVEQSRGVVNFEFYDMALPNNSVDDIPNSGALATGTTGNMDINALQQLVDPGDADFFAIRYTGHIVITEGGLQNFRLGSDDGSRLIINGQTVIDNDGLHAMRYRNGSINLEPGIYSIEVLFFERGGQVGLDLEYAAPGASLSDIPMGMLMAEPDRDSDGDGLADYRDIDSDNDGITDNVEAQSTAAYIAPTGLDSDGDGLDDAYDNAGSSGLTPVDTDSDAIADYLDADSDNDGINDIAERGDGAATVINNNDDSDNDGLLDIFEGSAANDGYDVNDENIAANGDFALGRQGSVNADGSNATPLLSDLLFRTANQAPVAANDGVFDVAEDSSASGNVLSNDSDANNDTLQVTTFSIAGMSATYNAGDSVTMTGIGTLQLLANGGFLFTPLANYHGPVPVITYTVSDGSATATATLGLRVTPVQDAPTAANDQHSGAEDQGAVSGNVLNNDSDIDGDTLQVATFSVNGSSYNAGETATIANAGQLVLQSDGSFSFTPLPDYHGNVPAITYTVSDGQGNTDAAQLLITITPRDDARDDSFTGNEDQTLNGNVADNDSFSAAASYSLASNASNGTVIMNTDGSFTYTPNADFAGNDSFTYLVSDAYGGTETRTVTLGIAAADDADDDAFTGNEDQVINGDVSSNDSYSGSTSYSLASNASEGNVVLNSDGSFSYTPNADFNGVDTFTYRVTDAYGNTEIQTVTLTVSALDDARDDAFSVNEDSVLNGNVATNDGFSGAAQYSLASGVSHGQLQLNADGSFSYTPTRNFTGTDTFSYTVTDSYGNSETQQVSITVLAINDAPSAQNDHINGDEDSVVSGNVLTNDLDIDGDNLTVREFNIGGERFTAGESHTIAGIGSFTLSANGTFSFTPAADFNGAVPVITYTIDDGNGGESSAQLFLSLRPVQDAPVAVDDTATTTEDSPISGQLLANDSDVDGDSLVVSSFIVAGDTTVYGAGDRAEITGVGRILINSDGSYLFEPAADFHGPVPVISYSVDDGNGGTAMASLSLNVSDQDDASDDYFTATEDHPFHGDVATNDSLSGTANYSLYSNPANGTLQLLSDGRFTYTPNADFFGQDQFQYSVTDAHGNREVQTVFLTVAAVNDAPQAGADGPLETSVNGSVEHNILLNDQDIDDNNIRVISFDIDGLDASYGAGETATLDGIGTLQINADGSIRFTPLPGFNGEIPVVRYTVSDGSGATDTASVTFKAIALPPRPIDATGPTTEPTTPGRDTRTPVERNASGDQANAILESINHESQLTGTAPLQAEGVVVNTVNNASTLNAAEQLSKQLHPGIFHETFWQAESGVDALQLKIERYSHRFDVPGTESTEPSSSVGELMYESYIRNNALVLEVFDTIDRRHGAGFEEFQATLADGTALPAWIASQGDGVFLIERQAQQRDLQLHIIALRSDGEQIVRALQLNLETGASTVSNVEQIGVPNLAQHLHQPFQQ
jgi:CshA-type fibril repeat protein